MRAWRGPPRSRRSARSWCSTRGAHGGRRAPPRRGRPPRAGSQATDTTPAGHDAPVVERLRAAGAVVLGKTATHEFAYGVTNRSVQNPWDGERLAGGSSGGSAVAAAIG